MFNLKFLKIRSAKTVQHTMLCFIPKDSQEFTLFFKNNFGRIPHAWRVNHYSQMQTLYIKNACHQKSTSKP